MPFILYAALGIGVGVISGFIGIGGGVILIPALVAFFKMTQHDAQGTTIAMMVPPIGIFAAMEYYKSGHVNIPAAAAIGIGFAAGGWIGAHYAAGAESVTLQRVFGATLVLIGGKMLFWS